MEKKIAVILNTESGSEQTSAKIKKIQEAFSKENIYPKIFLNEVGGDIEEKASQASVEGYNIIAAYGGDGTVSAVASGILGKMSTLGVIPGGTFNHFAKDLNIPLDIDKAVAVILHGHEIFIDIGKVNNKFFINNSSIGVYQKLVRHRESLEDIGWTKLGASVVALAKTAWLYPSLNIKIKSKEKEIVVRTPLVFIGNNEYLLEGVNVGRRKSLTDKKLSVHIADFTKRLDFIPLFFGAITENIKNFDGLHIYYTEKVIIESEKSYLNVALDGEVRPIQTPLVYEILPSALKVLVPQSE